MYRIFHHSNRGGKFVLIMRYTGTNIQGQKGGGFYVPRISCYSLLFFIPCYYVKRRYSTIQKPFQQSKEVCFHNDPFMPTGAFNICCPRDCVSRTANVEGNGRHKWGEFLHFLSRDIYRILG